MEEVMTPTITVAMAIIAVDQTVILPATIARKTTVTLVNPLGDKVIAVAVVEAEDLHLNHLMTAVLIVMICPVIAACHTCLREVNLSDLEMITSTPSTNG
jgi:hypothetical protein